MTVALLAGVLLTLLSIYPASLLHQAGRGIRWVPLLLSLGGLLATTAASSLLPLRLGARSLRRLEL
jgi:hypothetical protein